MSKKKIEVSTADGESAVLDMALTKTTAQVVVAAGLGLIGGLLASKLGDTNLERLAGAESELNTLKKELLSIEREDGIHQEHVDKAVADGLARANELADTIANLRAELGSRPTKAELDEANNKLVEISARLKAEADTALEQLANLNNLHEGKLKELAAVRAELEGLRKPSTSGGVLDSAVISLLQTLHTRFGVPMPSSTDMIDKVREAKASVLSANLIPADEFNDLNHKASQLAGLPSGSSILEHSSHSDIYSKLRNALMLIAEAQYVNVAYEESSLKKQLEGAANIFEVAYALESKKSSLGEAASYWWLQPKLSYGTAFLNRIMEIIRQGKQGSLFGNDFPIAIAYHGDRDVVMFTYSAANGVKYSSGFLREYFYESSAIGRVKLEGNSINQEFDLSINGFTLLAILNELNNPSYKYEGGHVRVSEGFLYRDYSAREGLADAVSLLGEHIEGRLINKDHFDSPLLTPGDIYFICELLKVKELGDAVSVRFFL